MAKKRLSARACAAKKVARIKRAQQNSPGVGAAAAGRGVTSKKGA